MQWKNNEWRHCHPPIEPGRVAQVESALGVSFPDDYKECVERCHGGSPLRDAFSFEDPVIGWMESGVGVLLSFTKDDENNYIVKTYKLLSPFLPQGAIPVVDDGGGDFVCLDYSHGWPPSVGYWHHGDRSLVPLAASFSEFLDMLHEGAPFTPEMLAELDSIKERLDKQWASKAKDPSRDLEE